MDLVAEAVRLSGEGVACVSLDVKLCGDGRKSLCFCKPWKNATPSSTEEYVFPGHNGLAALTGRVSDLYVIDVDVKDSGLDAWRYLEGKFSKIPDMTPMSRTGTGGIHYFFSLSASMEAGLKDPGCKARIRYDGDPIAVDTRGEGGVIVLPGTEYDGRKYEWIEVMHRGNLGPLPPWVIDLLNSNGNPRVVDEGDDMEVDSDTDDEIDVDSRITDRIKAFLLLTGDSTSYLDRVKNVPEGKMFVFRVSGPRVCVHGKSHSGSNNFSVILRGQSLLYCCNSAECQDLPRKEIGVISFADSTSGSTNCKVDPYDRSVYSVLTLRFMEKHMLDSDLGGSQVLATMYRRCGRIVYGPSRGCYYVWDGKRYVTDPKGDKVRLVCAHQLSGAYRRFRHVLEEMMANEEDPSVQKAFKEKIKSIPNWTKASSVKACMEFTKATMHRTGFEDSLGSNPDIINCANGVLCLKTGQLRPHSTEFMCDVVIDAEYKGLDYPSPSVDAFFEDIFNGDQEVIRYMQRLLGYSVTGHTSAEIMVIMYGTGANGKGILASMLSALLQDYYVAMQKGCVVKTDGQRSAAAGGASPHLAELKGKRVGVVDESAKDEKLDSATVKMCTGGGSINARFLYGQNFTFRATHQTFLLTNHRPELDVNDDAVRRRLVLVPFLNQYKTKEHFDPGNVHHRLRDDGLKNRLVRPEVLEEFLSWLARGAVAWYKEGLPETPELLRASLLDYYKDNDVLQQFIDDRCEVREDLRVSTTAFKGLLEQSHGLKLHNRDLVQEMTAKGFKKKVARFGGTLCQCFIGIGIRDDGAEDM